jgi:hypothetical protein
MIKTYAVLAAQYKGKSAALKATLTHALDEKLGVTLCGKIDESSLTESSDENAPATCPTCAKRDPRSKTGGPFVLSSMLQF